MKNLLVVVDMQNDFIDQALGTPEAVKTVPEVIKLISDPYYDAVIATMDTHQENYLETFEGINLPVKHCIRGSKGWKINKEVGQALESRNARIIEKPTFGSLELAEILKTEKPETVTFCGLCTDICVLSNALLARAVLYETPVIVYKNACAGVTPAKHESALDVMASCQIEIR